MASFTLSGLPFPDGKNPLGIHPEVEGTLKASLKANAAALLSASTLLTGAPNLTIGASNPPGGTEHELDATAQFPAAGIVRAALALLATASPHLVQGRADLGGQLDATLAGNPDLFDISPLPVHARAEFAGSLKFQPIVGGSALPARLISATANVLGLVIHDFGPLVPVNGTDNVIASTTTLLPAAGPRVIGVLRSPPYLFFDGTTYVYHDNASDADLNGGSNFSCAVLFDPEVANFSQSGTVCGKHDPSGTQFGWEVRWDKTTGLVTIVVSSNLSGTNRVERVNATAIRTRSIVVFTYDGTDIRIVLNGATDEGTQTTTGTPGSMVTTTAKFSVGARVNASNTASNHLRGAVCGVWVWNVTLSLSEAQGLTAQGVIPSPPQAANLQVAWDPYSIGSNGLNILFHDWIDAEGGRALVTVATPRPIVYPVEAAPGAVMAFSDKWDLNFVNNGSYGLDTNLTSNYPLNTSSTDASENGTYRLYTPPTLTTHPQITTGFRNFRSDITLFLRGRKNAASVTDVVFFDLLGFRLFYDQVSRDLFLFVGSTGTPDRYDYGRNQPLRAGSPAVLCLRWNAVTQTVSLIIGNLKVEPNAITATGSPASGTGLQLFDDADYKDARVIAACATDEQVNQILNELSGLDLRSFELESENWRSAAQAYPVPSEPFGAYVTDYAVDETPDDVLFILRGATGTLGLSGQPNDGDRFTISDGGSVRTFEFDSGGGVSGANVAVTIGGSVFATLDNLIAAINASALNITAGARANLDLTGDGVTDACYTRLNHDQVPSNPFSQVQNVAITIPTNVSGRLSATGMHRAFMFDEELPVTVTDQALLERDIRFRYTDEPYAVLEPEDLSDPGGGLLPFQNPNPIIISVIADVAHNVTATVNAGPTDAGPVEWWWEVEVETGNVETLIRIDQEEGSFSLNRDEVDTFTIPDGFNFKNKRIRFVIRSLFDPDQTWASLFVRMEGDNFDNSDTEVIIIPGTGAPEVPPVIDLVISLEQQQFALEEAAQTQLGRLQLSNRSRYKLTRVFFNDEDDPRLVGRNPDGREFGLMSTLADFEALGTDFQIHRVRSHEVGFPEQIAVRYYGAGFEDLWWVVAYANRIIDPELDMVEGQELVIPSRNALTTFLSRKPEPIGR